ncbi:MAG TPA: flagellar motor switch protein FliN [Bryobacteraceae bacterium]|nr:flagellar motor switch protein FliN [Bryobacteraceae bacterium]
MPYTHPAVANFLDHLCTEMRGALEQARPGETSVSWSVDEEAIAPNLVWELAALSLDSAATVLAGASADTWQAFGQAYESATGEPLENDFAILNQSIQAAARERFGAAVTCQANGPAQGPETSGPHAKIEIRFGGQPMDLTIVLSLELIDALGAAPQDASALPKMSSTNAVDRLLHIEVPVSVALGRAQMRMRDVLSLTSGSIVELEQELGDKVEIRVNNCVIARGEMVAVEGNYGVRIVEMVSNGGGVLTA